MTATGRSDISVTLVAVDGSVLVEAKSVLVVSAPPVASGQARAPAEPSAPVSILRAGASEQAQAPPARAPQLAPDERERALRMVKRGDEQLAQGGIAQARLLFERAAEAGLAEGAMALAATYDEVELGHLGVIGLKADRDAARRWYERARQLGAIEAEQRLRRFGAR